MARLRPLLLVLALLGPVACGGGDDEAEPAPQPAETQAALEDTSVKPELDRPTGAPPRRLETEDIVKGKGRAAKPGDIVEVHYVGVAFSTGDEFDASWDAGQPFAFPLGGGQVIEGWDRGIVGMRKGGRRLLTIPPELAYGPEGSPPAIGPNETLVFAVDLLRFR